MRIAQIVSLILVSATTQSCCAHPELAGLNDRYQLFSTCKNGMMLDVMMPRLLVAESPMTVFVTVSNVQKTVLVRHGFHRAGELRLVDSTGAPVPRTLLGRESYPDDAWNISDKWTIIQPGCSYGWAINLNELFRIRAGDYLLSIEPLIQATTRRDDDQPEAWHLIAAANIPLHVEQPVSNNARRTISNPSDLHAPQ